MFQILIQKIKILNLEIDSPILLAPVAMQQMAHADGELGMQKLQINSIQL